MTADLAGQVGGLETRFQSVTLEKPEIKERDGQDSPAVGDAPPKLTPAVDSPAEKTSAVTDESGPIRYRIEYVGKDSGTFSIQGRTATLDASEEPPVFEYVEVRLSSQKELTSATKAEDIKKTDKGKGRAYINIFSPAVAEALRCVVDYFPKLDLSGNVIKILEPYSVFVFYEKEFTAYRERAAKLAAAGDPSCPNRWAARHLGIVQEFVKEHIQEAVNAERARHARGYATFDMLWLLYRPGIDAYFDVFEVAEHEPYVVSSVDYELVNGSTSAYEVTLWHIDADSVWVGPASSSTTIQHFAGEKKITSLSIYPCEYLRFTENITEDEVLAIRQHFVNRGKKWFNLRRKVGCHYFDGITIHFPRRTYSSLVMVDPIHYAMVDARERTELLPSLEQPSGPVGICACQNCEEVIYSHATKPKFAKYSRVNPLLVDEISEHQYFLCDQSMEAFVFKIRAWKLLRVDGFQDPVFDSALFDRLVMKNSTKELIKDLTQVYIRDNAGSHLREERLYTKITDVCKAPAASTQTKTTWSPDFIEGKGEGLTILLHGGPGVGKTYTAECIAEFIKKPLLSLTCSDIGVKPETIEENLVKWFKAAEKWGAVMLVDEADIYMEERQVQDIERNHLVAGFLRALEYYKGILFITTNRVGTFDEAFISRIHLQIHYPNFEHEERERLWNTFFEKLEEDRETTMRITQSAKDYVQSQEMQALEWNGREIRNAFQVAVALAEAQSQKDKEGRILIKSDHLKATVQMSREFRNYLAKLHKGDLSKKASRMGNRYDAFGKDASGSTPSKF